MTDFAAAFFSLAPPEVRALVEAALEPQSFAFGATVVNEGDRADALYVITSGAARVVVRADDGREVPLAVLRAGDIFGEAALIGGGTRMATVRATGPLDVLRLDQAVFDALVRSNPDVRRWAERQAASHELFALLYVHSAFRGLPAQAVTRLVGSAEPVAVAAGDAVIVEADPPGPAYLVRSGRLRVLRRRDGDDVTVGVLRRGDLFGERSLLLREPRSATVVAVTDADVLRLPADAVTEVLDANPDVRRRLERRAARYELRHLVHVPLDFADVMPDLADFDRAGAERTGEAGGGGGTSAEVDVAIGVEDGADADEVFRRPRKRIRRFPVVFGVDEMDCGAACLAAVARHFGRRVPLTAVRAAVGTDLDGTSLHGLVAGAERLGLTAQAVKASPSRLDTMPLPAICHWDGNHWVVLHDTRRRAVRVVDPGVGSRRIDREEWDARWTGFACFVAPTPAFEDLPEAGSPWRWLGPFFRPHRRTLAIAALLAPVAAALQMLVPVLSGAVVDRALAGGDRGLLHLLALAMAAMLLAAVGAQLVQRWLLARLALRFDADSLDHVTSRLLALPARYFATRRTGDIERRIGGMRQVRQFLVQQGVVGLSAASQALVALFLMTTLSLRLTATYALTIPFHLLAMRHSRRRVRPLLATLEDAFGRYHSRQIDSIKGIETAKAAAAEEALRRDMRRQLEALATHAYRADTAFMRYDSFVQLTTFLSLALVLWAGGLLVLDGVISVGVLVGFVGLTVLANGPVLTLLRLWDALQYTSVLLGRVDDVLSQEPEQGHDRTDLRPVPTLGGAISIQRLTVVAEGPDPVTILDDVSLEVEPGATIALCGRSGAGKTTLARCLAGLAPIAAGRVLYDGVDLQTLDHRALRRRMGFVLQEDHLFDDTIAANIALGDDEVDIDRVRWAAAVADAAEFIERLPLGYGTRIGETGLRLSGGQAQRIAIARAVYRQPAVLVLDEATSMLDTESERAVKRALDALTEGRTTFVIAHRLSTVRDADLIVVLDRGRIAEQGRHDELLRRRGLYWQLASDQLDS